MTVTLELSDEAVARLRIEAARRGVTPDDVVTQLVESLDRTSRTPARKCRASVALSATGARHFGFQSGGDVTTAAKCHIRPGTV